MSGSATNPYLRTKILTASPEELRLMLYEGALRFCRQARQAIEAQDYETSYQSLMRAQKIVLELSNSLKPEVEPELCKRLSALYTYIYRLLVDANMRREIATVDEAIKLLDYERETWQMLMERLTGDETPAQASAPAPSDTAPAATAPRPQPTPAPAAAYGQPQAGGNRNGTFFHSA